MPKLGLTKAFTLIEVIIYLGLFSMLMSGILVSVYPLLTNSERLTAHVLRESEVAFITEKIGNTLATDVVEDTVVVSSPAQGDTENTLVIRKGVNELLRIEEDDSLTLCTAPRVCNMLIWSENGNPPLPLNNERISIDNFTVSHSAPTVDSTRILEISFTANGVPVGPLRYHLHF